MKHPTSLALGAAAVAVAIGIWHQWDRLGATLEQSIDILDPARVQLIRTPGGFLQVSEMRKVEEFAWQTSWDCPVVDCSNLPRTVSRIRVTAHYVYRIPLASEWRLEPDGDGYRLVVPQVQVQAPVAFDTRSAEIATSSSLFAPAASANRDKVLRHLGPELAQRGASAPYVDAQQRAAESTVREFAQKWMREQGKALRKPVRVVFQGPHPA